MAVNRRKFQGVLNILSFNRHFYVYGVIGLIGILLILELMDSPNYISYIIIAAFSYGLLMPLIVSAYVYDFSGYYNFDWLKDNKIENSEQTLKLINIHAGFDETSYILKTVYPDSDLQVFDFYNPKDHTEPAIVRARKVSNMYPDTKVIESDQLPVEDNSIDIVFLLSAAHEIRNEVERVKFLSECKRVCKPTGKVITVEHLRDFPNFVAFSIGFTHFFSRKSWLRAFNNAGLSTVREEKFTPFMSVFTASYS